MADMQLPFDQSKLDKLLDDHDIDFLIINDKNTAQYLLGGYKFFSLRKKTQLYQSLFANYWISKR